MCMYVLLALLASITDQNDIRLGGGGGREMLPSLWLSRWDRQAVAIMRTLLNSVIDGTWAWSAAIHSRRHTYTYSYICYISQ